MSRHADRWDVVVDVWSPDLRLGAAWLAMEDGPWAIAETVGIEVGDAAHAVLDDAGGLRAWVVLRVTAGDAEDATSQGSRFLAAVAGRLDVEQDPRASVAVVARRASPDAALEDVLGTLRPDCYEPSTRPVAWSAWRVRGPRAIEIGWTSGVDPVAAVDVAEAPTAITITLHEQRPPALRRDGAEVGELLVLRSRTATVDLAAPVGDRAVIDGFSGERRPRA